MYEQLAVRLEATWSHVHCTIYMVYVYQFCYNTSQSKWWPRFLCELLNTDVIAMCEEQAARGPARNYRRYTGLNPNSTRLPSTWSPSHMEKGETGIFLWKPHTGSVGLEPRMHAWLVRQSSALPIVASTTIHLSYSGELCTRADVDFQGIAKTIASGRDTVGITSSLPCPRDGHGR